MVYRESGSYSLYGTAIIIIVVVVVVARSSSSSSSISSSSSGILIGALTSYTSVE